MSLIRSTDESSKELMSLLFLVLITDITIILNIPFLRQILGFLFLTILPGILILQILKFDKIDFLERFILSWGLSISFLMFFGLLINNLSLYCGYETPLATNSLLISFNLAIIVLAIIKHRLNETQTTPLPNLNLNTSEKAFLIVPIFFPVLSIFGMNLMNTTDDNIVLMFLLFLIPIYVALVCFSNHKFPKRLYPVVIFLIGLSLLLLTSLRSNHLIGADTHVEYYFFQTTLSNLYWSVEGCSTLNACLSISLLPTIYQSLLNISSEFLFKILYSLIYSISPIAIYVLSRKYIGDSYAFVSSCFFMFQIFFLRLEANSRTSIAVLFFILAMVALFNDKIDPLKKRILFMVFMASCMVSHYSTTYIFFFIILGSFISMKILPKRYTLNKFITSTTIILFIALIFFWYSQVTEAAFNSGVNFIKTSFDSLNKFFITESRGEPTQMLFGKNITQKGIPHKVEFVFTWLTFGFIGTGIITVFRKYREMLFLELNFKKSVLLKKKFEVEYFMIALICSGLLVAMVVVPRISQGYSLDRLYIVATAILSVFFVIGGISISSFFLKKNSLLKKQKNMGGAVMLSEKENALQFWTYLIILAVLIPYFLSITGVMYNIFGVPRAIILNSEGEQYDQEYVHDQDSYGAKWLARYKEKGRRMYTYANGDKRLTSQGILSMDSIDSHSLIENKTCIGYIYLIYYNVVDGKLLEHTYGSSNLLGYSHQLVGKSKIYANGGSEIYN